MSLAKEVSKQPSNQVVVKVALLGDAGIGKTSLMVKYVEDRYDVEYIQTLGLNFMEKTVHLRNVDVTISVWDLGGQQEFGSLMSLVLEDAKAVLFAFDLTSKLSLQSVHKWYKDARKFNGVFMPFLIGTKFDLFAESQQSYKQQMTKQARRFAIKMNAPLIYCSSSKAVNVKKNISSNYC